MAQRRVETKRAKYLAMSKRTHDDPSFSDIKLTVYSFLRASAMSTPKQNAGDVAGTPGEEAPRDPGALADRAAVIANNGDLDNGHRVFHGYGFHMPTTAYRRRGHRRHHKHHRITNGHNKGNKSSRDEDDDDEEEEMLPQNLRPCKCRLFKECQSHEFFVCFSADRVHFILGQEEDMDGHESHPLFSELAELYINNEELEWRETAR